MSEHPHRPPRRRTGAPAAIAGAVVSLAIISTALTDEALGADFFTVPSPLGSYSWAGPYLGATVGYEWGTVQNNPTRPAGVEGGIEAGYNWRNGFFVYGAETDISLSDANNTFAPWQFSNPWFGTVRGRAGFAAGNVLLFGTAGLAFGELRGQSGTVTESHDGVGFAGGLGVEVGFTPRWSAKAEWLYLDFTNQNFAVTSTSNGLAANLLRLGLNYRF
jgi:outer membrane immunogenic protein